MGAVLLTALKVILPQPTPYSKDSVEEFMRLARRGPIIHRGGEPENTLAAIRQSKMENAMGVEIDIMLTGDGYCVVLHDETVDRTSNGSGEVRSMTLKELKQLRFFGRDKAAHSDLYSGEQISTLEEAVSLCEELDLIVFLDIKPFKTEKDLRKLLHIFEGKEHLYNRVCIFSYYISALYKLRRIDPKVQCGFAIYCNSLLESVDGRKRTSLWADVFSPVFDWLYFKVVNHCLLEFVGVKMVLFCKDDIIAKRISLEDWRRGDQKILAWTVNSRAEQEDFKKRDVPFFTDSAIREMPEAWIPPQRRMTLSFLAQKRSWTILMLILVPPLFYWGFPVPSVWPFEDIKLEETE